MTPIEKYKLLPSNFGKYYELFLQNSGRRNKYKFKFKNDNQIYIGIPTTGSFVSTVDDNEEFTLNVLEPEGSKGTYRIPYGEIDSAEEIKV